MNNLREKNTELTQERRFFGERSRDDSISIYFFVFPSVEIQWNPM